MAPSITSTRTTTTRGRPATSSALGALKLLHHQSHPDASDSFEHAAQFATASRLIACLVNEGLVHATLLDSAPTDPDILQAHVAVVNFGSKAGTNAPSTTRTPPVAWARLEPPAGAVHVHGSSSNVAAILVSLRAVPLTRPGTAQIRCLDPDDLAGNASFVVASRDARANGTRAATVDVTGMTTTADPRAVWDAVAAWNQVPASNAAVIRDELASSAQIQAILFQHPPNLGKLPTLTSSALDWENAVVEGHATHPMHRTRRAFAPLAFTPTPDGMHALQFPDLVLFAVPLTRVHAHGTWLSDVHPRLLEHLPSHDAARVPADHVLFPVHGHQAAWVRVNFPEFVALSVRIPALAQASTRTLVVPDERWFPDGAIVKTSISMTITSAMRTVSPYTVQNAPIMSAIAHIVNEGRDFLFPIDEFASIGLDHPDEAVAKAMGCVLRADPERLLAPHDEKVIMCAALVERDVATGVPHVVRAFGLHSPAQRLAWFTEYAKLLVQCLVPPLAKYAFAFEGHGQNMLLRVRPGKCDGDAALVGFAVRDYGGALVHVPTYRAALDKHDDLTDKLRPGSFQLASSPEAAYRVAYHTMVACHLHRLARVIGLHQSGAAWRVVREAVRGELAPFGGDAHPLARAWLYERDVDAKAFLRMKCGGLYRDYVYERVPNLLFAVDEEEKLKCGEEGRVPDVAAAE
ncbi:hypothetical protein AMAG_02132 [Allomyces macrogynus ATCC 38327]|uniref:Aerobactin siderophore biosynthesis IucA/IucC N-terminal domain-containing protein n=1 Tax=Allomyces macrogynus (strain ATCC 38327) TaxID=578462 RepID=A0A0L0S1R5_ALLM3|nr:hypothetical protein AMAG_02132 [Allomyces macrogynus ATCC 38327]|eukprot:KNE56309.1 hypothetical protein AMAG_02132 [Allomyces macrogynus ATCC 38327]